MAQAVSLIPPSQADREPAPSRRSLLSFLTGAFVAAPVVMASTGSALAAPSLQEAPEILEIGQQLPALREANKAAVARKMEAAALYERTRPAIPADLLRPMPFTRSTRDLCEEDIDIDGSHVWEPIPGVAGQEGPRWIYRYRLVQSYIVLHEVSARTKEGRALRKLARIAKKYEAETKAVRFASGYDERCGDAYSVVSEIDKLAWRLRKLKPCTAAGCLVYANALMAVEECFDDFDTRGRGFRAHLGGLLAGALIRITAARNV